MTMFTAIAFASVAVFAAATATPTKPPKPAKPPAATAPVTPAPAVTKDFCKKGVAVEGFTPAVRASSGAGVEFPDAEVAGESEGWVKVGFTIDAEGATKDIVVLDQVGPPAMARAARLAVKRWVYKPAREGERAVEQYGNTVELVFRRENVGNTGVHDEAVAKFDQGRTFVAAGKYGEGIAVLEETLESPLTLYEQAKVSFALAFAYEKSNDRPRALAHIRHALIEGGRFLDKGVVPSARRMRVRLEAANGNLVHAACAAALPAADSFDPTGADIKETARVVADAKARLSALPALEVEATLVRDPAVERGGVWEKQLTRTKFRFARVIGIVEDFRLVCTRQLAGGAVNESGHWSVPADAGTCTLRVAGEVGAAFKLIEEW